MHNVAAKDIGTFVNIGSGRTVSIRDLAQRYRI
jgi:hypothetical protein